MDMVELSQGWVYGRTLLFLVLAVDSKRRASSVCELELASHAKREIEKLKTTTGEDIRVVDSLGDSGKNLHSGNDLIRVVLILGAHNLRCTL